MACLFSSLSIYAGSEIRVSIWLIFFSTFVITSIKGLSSTLRGRGRQSWWNNFQACLFRRRWCTSLAHHHGNRHTRHWYTVYVTAADVQRRESYCVTHDPTHLAPSSSFGKCSLAVCCFAECEQSGNYVRCWFTRWDFVCLRLPLLASKCKR